MLRTITSALAALALTVTAAIGGEISDADNGFRVTVPDDWTTERPPIASLAIVVASPRRAETGGNCNIVVVAVDETRSMSQAEIEAELSAQINEAFWRGEISTVKGFKSTTIEKSGDKTQRGRKVFFAKSTSEFVINGNALTVTQLVDLHAIPGRMYAVTCTALAAGFEREASDFESIMASFEPGLDMTVAAFGPRMPPAWARQNRGHAVGRAAWNAAAHGRETGLARARHR